MRALRWAGDTIRYVFTYPISGRIRTKRVTISAVVLVLVGTGLAWIANGARTPPARPAPDGGACEQPETQMLATLPTIDIIEYQAFPNSCLGTTTMTRWVHQLLPSDESGLGISLFLKRVAGLAARLSKVNDSTSCGYRSDRLTVMLYRSRRTSWSVGLVAVVRGSGKDAMRDTSDCFLIRQEAPAPAVPGDRTAGPGPGPQWVRPNTCTDSVSRTFESEDYTIISIGSSTDICRQMSGVAARPTASPHLSRPPDPRALERSVPGQGSIKKVHGVVLTEGLRRRTGPGREFPAPPGGPPTLARGAIALVICYTQGEQISNYMIGLASSSWVKIDDQTVRGFVPHAHLDTAGDIDRQVRSCSTREIADSQYVEHVAGTAIVDGVAVRASPSRSAAEITRLAYQARVEVICYVDAEPVTAGSTSNDRWLMVYPDRDARPGFVTAVYLRLDGEIIGSPCLP